MHINACSIICGYSNPFDNLGIGMHTVKASRAFRAGRHTGIINMIRPLKIPLRLIPESVHTTMISRVANHMMHGQDISERLLALEDKIISIHIRDIPLTLQFVIRAGQLHRSHRLEWDSRISGELADFWALATRAEDPDTLFFSRRLNIEGDTELGLYIKNLLDGLDYDWQAHFEDVIGRRPPQPPRSLVRFIARIKSGFLDR